MALPWPGAGTRSMAPFGTMRFPVRHGDLTVRIPVPSHLSQAVSRPVSTPCHPTSPLSNTTLLTDLSLNRITFQGLQNPHRSLSVPAPASCTGFLQLLLPLALPPRQHSSPSWPPSWPPACPSSTRAGPWQPSDTCVTGGQLHPQLSALAVNAVSR